MSVLNRRAMKSDGHAYGQSMQKTTRQTFAELESVAGHEPPFLGFIHEIKGTAPE